MSSSNPNKRSASPSDQNKKTKKKKKILWDFSVPDRNLTDVILVVEGQKFHVLKGRLAQDSRQFYTLFFETHRDQPEIELTGFGAEEFQSFLQILYGFHASGGVEMALKVMEIANRYDVGFIRGKCEKKLFFTSQLGKKEKMEIALKFRLNRLKKILLDEIKTFEDLEAVLPSDLASLDSSTMKAVLEKSLKFNRDSNAPPPVSVPAALPRVVPAPVSPAQAAPAPAAPIPDDRDPEVIVLDDIDPEVVAAPEVLNRRPRRPRQAQRARNRAPQ